MQPDAYRVMQNLQERHWWWRGMRRLYRAALRRSMPARPTRPRRVIDIGCGFGANLPVLNEWGAVVGVDVELDALRAITQRPALGLVQAEADALPFRAGTFDVIGLLAVIEHAPQDARVLAETYRIARPGAIQLILTSAFMLLWSHHDEANRHYRRYRRGALETRLRDAHWHSLYSGYLNSAIFPAVAVVRLIQRRWHAPGTAAYDMGPSFGPLNALLDGALAAEGWLLVHTPLRLPFGVDLFNVARRDE